MNDQKICFITCVNNEEEYRTCVAYIESLYVPEGYKVEIISIENAKSLTSGYNEAMKRTDAKYKVYLHQDTYLIHKNFIVDILVIFQKHSKLGMLGTLGGKQIPSKWEGWPKQTSYGGLYHTMNGKEKMDILLFQSVKNQYEPVIAIDGFLMVTQYDVPWREDVFKGWHMYDISQSFEFLIKGYDVGVVKQANPWCFHDCHVISTIGYKESYQLFLREYRKTTFGRKISRE